ncbi:MAG: hypothetical protein AMS24_02505 [Chlamydiae bacterium SM23_39]|nr:MAG: hypothetical protein AMS24_02505 [Chlamydiae bacterium SM23_39]
MYKFKIITIGKIKEQWLKDAIDEYEKRLKNRAKIKWILLKDEKKLIDYTEKEKKFICLDQQGQSYTSKNFSKFIQKNNISFLIGNEKGIPLIIKKKAFLTISLSNLTFTHQMARLILIEQIYRSLEIIKNSNYHK